MTDLQSNLPVPVPSGKSGRQAERNGLHSVFDRLLRRLGLRVNGNTVRQSLEELIEVDGADEIEIDNHERTLIRNVLGLREITAVEVMVPRADIVAVDVNTPIPELVRQITRVAHSRIPVYQDNLDNVIGMVHIKDVMLEREKPVPASLMELKREVIPVSPTMRVLDLLHQMRENRRHLALVVDEFGGIDGLITIEDIIETIVGEITDEHDVLEGPRIILQEDGTAIADARATVEELEAVTGIALSSQEREEIDTVAGLIFSIADRIALSGETIRYPDSGLEFEIVDADARRLKRVRVRWQSSPGDKSPR